MDPFYFILYATFRCARHFDELSVIRGHGYKFSNAEFWNQFMTGCRKAMVFIYKAQERGCFLELNANPKRLDIKDVYCRAAREKRC